MRNQRTTKIQGDNIQKSKFSLGETDYQIILSQPIQSSFEIVLRGTKNCNDKSRKVTLWFQHLLWGFNISEFTLMILIRGEPFLNYVVGNFKRIFQENIGLKL